MSSFIQKYFILRWLLIIASAFLLGTLVEFFGLPGSHFFGGVIVGIVVALFNLQKKAVFPRIAFDASLAVTGVVLGAYFSPSSVTEIITNFVPIIIISLGTLGLSLIVGFLLSRITDIPLSTSLLGMLAGGSAMNVITSDKIQADVRVVTLMHLLRLILVLIATPILIHYFLAPNTVLNLIQTASPESTSPFVFSLFFTIILAIVGGYLAIKFPFSGSLLLTPLFLAAVLSVVGPFKGITPPEGFREVAAMIIGLQVGLRFDKEILITTKKYIPIMTLLMVVVLIGCGVFAWFLTLTTPFNALTAYLSTTPGGRTAVVSLAFTTGADTTAVLAIQTLRLLIMTLVAPLAINFLVKGRSRISNSAEEILD